MLYNSISTSTYYYTICWDVASRRRVRLPAAADGATSSLAYKRARRLGERLRGDMPSCLLSHSPAALWAVSSRGISISKIHN